MTPIHLGPPIHREGGYAVCEVLGVDQHPEGFTFNGPGFSALIIYPNFGEALVALQAMLAHDDSTAGPEHSTARS